MKLGFDIDCTLNNIHYHAVDVFNKVLGTKVTYKQVDKTKSIYFNEAFNMTLEERKNVWAANEYEIYSTCSPLPFAVETLNKWESEGHDIFYITARKNTAEIVTLTKDWLLHHGFPYKESQFHIGMKDEDKSSIIQFLKLDMFVDDKPSVIDTLIRDKVNFQIKDQPYNRHYSNRRILSWDDAIL